MLEFSRREEIPVEHPTTVEWCYPFLPGESRSLGPSHPEVARYQRLHCQVWTVAHQSEVVCPNMKPAISTRQ